MGCANSKSVEVTSAAKKKEPIAKKEEEIKAKANAKPVVEFQNTPERTVLILTEEESLRARLQVSETIKKLEADGAKFKWTTYDAFQDGKRLSTYDAVFAIPHDKGRYSLSLQEDFY